MVLNTTIIILAAGLGSRMNGEKMLVPFKGKPMICHAVEAALASNALEVKVVIGHESEKVRKAFFTSAVIASECEAIHKGQKLDIIIAKDYSKGLSESLKAGIRAVKSAGALIMLGDMPLITPQLINKLISEFKSEEDIIVPTHNGEMGNPVLWGRAYFETLLTLEGDKGARSLLSKLAHKKIEVKDPSIFKDFDTRAVIAEFSL